MKFPKVRLVLHKNVIEFNKLRTDVKCVIYIKQFSRNCFKLLFNGVQILNLLTQLVNCASTFHTRVLKTTAN